MNRAKSVFGCTEVEYLGFIVNFNGLQPDPEKNRGYYKLSDPEKFAWPS